MTELVKIHSAPGSIDTVNARELHEFLENKDMFAHWIKKRIEKYDFKEHVDYIIIKSPDLNFPNKKDYYITIDMAKQLAMVENNQKGQEARKYFIECENKLKQILSVPAPKQPDYSEYIPKSFKAALLDYVDALEDLEEANYMIEYEKTINNENKPKVQEYELLMDDKNHFSIEEFCKVLKPMLNNKVYGRNSVFDYLRTNGIIYINSNIPQQTYVNSGYFDIRLVNTNVGNRSKLLLTPKGFKWLKSKMLKDGFVFQQ